MHFFPKSSENVENVGRVVFTPPPPTLKYGFHCTDFYETFNGIEWRFCKLISSKSL
jgi:hypothetical protein